MATIEDYLRLHAERTPDKEAIRKDGRAVTYGELWAMARRAADALGDARGRAVAFRATCETETVARYLGIHMAGATAVPLDKGMPEELYEELCARLAATPPPEGVADILFTTGTTGRQKGVMIGPDTIVANAENLVEAQGYAGDVEFVVNGPLNHIGSLSKIPPTIYAGGTVTLVDGMRDMGAFFTAIETAKREKVATFLVPASIRMLLALGRKKLAGLAGRLDFIETGAAPMSQADMETLRATLPTTRLYNTYASTETGIIATHDFGGGECIAGCLGRPMRHSGLRIGADGHVECWGRTLMAGYYGDAELTRATLRDGVIRTNDMGTIDEEGRLRLTGRDDDVINTGGFKVNPTEVEDAAMGAEHVRDCICVAAESKMTGTVLKLIVVTDGTELDKRSLAAELGRKLEPHKVPTVYERAESVKRTFNGKLDRKAYR
ncbi:MAG: class I adenylate-forming enzyme family protein [Marinilabiliaceae bacterium]